jgi:RPA family protein
MREVAHRTFAQEFNDATYTFRESDDDRAPLYVLLPTGAKANRVFVVGTLTETEDVGTDEEYWQGRIVDPTGTFFAYAGQYQPEAAGMLRDTEPPAFVAVVGKPRTYETDEGNVNVSLRPEHITIADEITRHRWVVETAERTLERLEAFDDDANEYAQMAREQYGDATEQYRHALIEALEPLDAAGADATNEAATESGEPEIAGQDGTEDSDGDVDEDPAATTTEPADDSGSTSTGTEGETTDPDTGSDLGAFDPGEFSSDDE